MRKILKITVDSRQLRLNAAILATKSGSDEFKTNLAQLLRERQLNVTFLLK